MAKTRTGSVRERPDTFFAVVTFTDETGANQKMERQAESQRQAQQFLKQILQELSKRKEITITGKRIKEKRGGIFARVTYVDERGQRREQERRAENRTQAKEIIKQMLRELDDHGAASLDASQMTFAQLANYYRQTYLIEPEYVDGRKVAGLRSKYDFEKRLDILNDFFGRRKVRSITYGDLERYKAVRLKTPVVIGRNTRGTDKPGKLTTRQRTIASVNRELGLLRRVFNVAVENGWLPKNPFAMGKAIITVADEKHRDRIVTREEEARLIAACTGKRDHLRPIIICALDTGMRRGEMLKLKWMDVDFESRVIMVQAFNTKTMRERLVVMSDRLAEELEALYTNSIKDPNQIVFGITSEFKKAFLAARRSVGLDDVRFHDLRHTHATRLVSAHLPLSEVGRMLGHTQANTTFRYVNANIETARRAALLINDFNCSVDTPKLTIN